MHTTTVVVLFAAAYHFGRTIPSHIPALTQQTYSVTDTHNANWKRYPTECHYFRSIHVQSKTCTCLQLVLNKICMPVGDCVHVLADMGVKLSKCELNPDRHNIYAHRPGAHVIGGCCNCKY
jgi:hypothetical protein